MGMESPWNEADRGNVKYSERNLSQFHVVYHKFHIDWPGIESRPPRRLTVNFHYIVYKYLVTSS